jgi:hypothetical protein
MVHDAKFRCRFRLSHFLAAAIRLSNDAIARGALQSLQSLQSMKQSLIYQVYSVDYVGAQPEQLSGALVAVHGFPILGVLIVTKSRAASADNNDGCNN